ncbi:KRAB-A domain-containing protein 2-like [Palaemon carinicauda]|uniref:KRAB-A domain-containing protein 2-like n=1 Tax=Palaemon carinicauda TaxID=392227 RepID=UPI0035B60CF6
MVHNRRPAGRMRPPVKHMAALEVIIENTMYHSLYEVLQCGDVEKLIKARSSPEDQPSYYVSIEDVCLTQKAHIATGHGRRDCMLKQLSLKYANITREAVDLFKSYCIIYQEETNRPKTKGVLVCPILTEDFNSRCQVDLIDMQSSPQAQYKWIMVYQCHLTKFVILRLLMSKRTAEVAFQLLDIFFINWCSMHPSIR